MRDSSEEGAGRPRGYLHRADGSWKCVGDDGWPVSFEEFYAPTPEPLPVPMTDVGPVTDAEDGGAWPWD